MSTKIQKVCATADESSWQLRSALQAPSLSNQMASPTEVSAATPSPYFQQSHTQPSFHATQQQLEPFILTFIRGNISVCFGCKQQYGKAIQPPNDLCVTHRKWKSLMLPGSSTPQSKYGNAKSPLAVLSNRVLHEIIIQLVP